VLVGVLTWRTGWRFVVHRILSVFAVSLVFLLSAAGSTHRPQVTSSILVRTDWLAAHLKDKNIVILHVGTDRKTYDAGHIPGARFLGLSDIVAVRNGIPNELPTVNTLKATFERLGIGNQSRVVIYGDMAGLFAARAYFSLDYLGRGDSTALLDGGLEKWKAEHREVSIRQNNVAPATLTAKPRPELIIELATVKQVVAGKGKKVALIDARPFSDYAGTRPYAIRVGHIPGAKNVFWADNLVSRDNPVLKSAADIRARYEAAGVRPGSKVVVYCQTGVQATYDYFTLKLTGFSPMLYDGSFSEWSSAEGTVVETGIPHSN